VTRPGLYLERPVERLTAPALQVAIDTTLNERRADTRMKLRSSALLVDAGGLIDLAKSQFGNFAVDAKLLTPGAIAPNLRGRDVLARVVLDAWRSAGMGAGEWREAQPLLHEEFAGLAKEAYHETNRWLVENKVLPEVDLRPFIRRSRTHPGAQMGFGGWGSSFAGDGGPNSAAMALGSPSEYPTSAGFAAPGRGGYWVPAGSGRQVGEETRLMTRAAPLARSREI
jgi:hypothetical protein